MENKVYKEFVDVERTMADFVTLPSIKKRSYSFLSTLFLRLCFVLHSSTYLNKKERKKKVRAGGEKPLKYLSL